jgi:hypothetical protein
MTTENKSSSKSTFFYIRITALVGVLAVIAFVYFGHTADIATTAETALRNQIESESHGQIQLVSFRKTDGEKRNDGRYELDYEAQIRFAAAGQWLTHDVMNYSVQGLTFSFSTAQPREGNSFDALNGGMAGGVAVHFFDEAKIAGRMIGDRKESGWKFESVDSHIVSDPPSH